MKNARKSSSKSKGRASVTKSRRRAAPPRSKVQLASRSDLKKWRDIGMRSVAAAARPAMVEAEGIAATHKAHGQENEEGTTRAADQTKLDADAEPVRELWNGTE